MNYDQNRKPGFNGSAKPAARTAVKKPPLDKLTYVGQAETVIRDEIEKDNRGNPKLSTSQIRNILTMTNELYNAVRFSNEAKLTEELCSHIQYIKMKIAYSAGREKIVKDFAEKSCLMQYLDEVGDSREKLITFCHYAEALVAYHKFYGGEEKYK